MPSLPSTSAPFTSARPLAVLLAASAMLLSACGSAAQQSAGPTGGADSSAAQQSAGTTGATDSGDHYPVTVQNCGADVTFTSAPERLVLLKSASVPALHDLGVLDRAVARAGAYPDAYYDEATRAELTGIEHLTGDLDSSGHLHISRDVVIAQEPDLVLGEVENLGRDSMAAVGIPLIEEPALCPNAAPEDPSFQSVYDQVGVYGTIFNVEDRAQQVNGSLQDRVAAVEERVGEGDGRTAAVLYPTVGGGTTYAYGTQSMAQPQLEAAGFTNVFGDVDERVFEVSPEELIGRNPDVLILLHSEGDPQAVEDAVEALPGADQISAVADGEMMVHLINFTEPATPLAVDGLEAIVERFHR